MLLKKQISKAFLQRKAFLCCQKKKKDMKLLLIIAFFTCLFSVSCSKNNSGQSGLITGSWELRGFTGGIAGTILYQPGNGTILAFGSNGHYVFSSPGAVSQTGTYQIKESANTGDWILHANYTVNGQAKTETDSIRFSGNRMTFLPSLSCCDIAANFYERLP
jgi:hypothetical protein